MFLAIPAAAVIPSPAPAPSRLGLGFKRFAAGAIIHGKYGSTLYGEHDALALVLGADSMGVPLDIAFRDASLLAERMRAVIREAFEARRKVLESL